MLTAYRWLLAYEPVRLAAGVANLLTLLAGAGIVLSEQQNRSLQAAVGIATLALTGLHWAAAEYARLKVSSPATVARLKAAETVADLGHGRHEAPDPAPAPEVSPAAPAASAGDPTAG